MLSSVDLPEGFTWSDEYSEETAVGNYGTNTFNATFTPSDINNCNVVNCIAVTVNVARAKPNVTAPLNAETSVRTGLTLADISLPDGWSWNAPATVPQDGVSYSATYTPADAVNYSTVIADILVTVHPCAHSWSSWHFDSELLLAKTCTVCGEKTGIVKCLWNSFMQTIGIIWARTVVQLLQAVFD